MNHDQRLTRVDILSIVLNILHCEVGVAKTECRSRPFYPNGFSHVSKVLTQTRNEHTVCPPVHRHGEM